MLWFPNKILKTGGARSGPCAERRAAMPNSMRIPFSARSSAAILIFCGKTALESKDESLRFTGTPIRGSTPPQKQNHLLRGTARQLHFTGMRGFDDLRRLLITGLGISEAVIIM